jgi:hypothetical protein
MEIDFSKLTAEQEQTLREIVRIGEHIEISLGWAPTISDENLARQARQIGWEIKKLQA